MTEFSAGMNEILMTCILGYGPGLILGVLIWAVARRSAPMPLFFADLVSLLVPIAVWATMCKYHWTQVTTEHSAWEELMIVGWVWSGCFIARLLIPRFTHKLRFRLAAIHVGSIAIAAVILLSLFFKGFAR